MAAPLVSTSAPVATPTPPLSADDLLDGLPDPTFVVDGQWRIVRTNAAARTLLGPAAAVAGEVDGFWRALPDAAEPSRQRLYRAALAAAGPLARFDQPLADRSAWYAVRCRALPADRLLVTFTDVTELRRSDADVAEREQRYRLIFERSPQAIFVYDVETKRVTMANDAMLSLYGYARADLIGMDVFTLCDPADVPWARSLVESFANLTPNQNLQIRHRRADGSPFPVVVTSHGFVVAGRPVRAALITDMTEQERSERDLRESERKYRSLIETADSVVLALDFDHRITEWNGAAERVSGYTRAEVLGVNYLDRFLPPEIRPAVEAESGRLFSGTATRGFEGILVTRDGSRRTILWNAHRQTGPQGQVTGLVAVGQDITDRKRAEDALRASEQLHRTLGDALPQLMWTLTPQGAFEYANARFVEFTGLAAADLAYYGTDANAWSAFVNPEDLPTVASRWSQIKDAGTPGEFEVRWCGGQQCTEDGHWFIVRLAPQIDPAGRTLRWVGTATDVDELKRAHADLQRARDAAVHANEAKDQFLAVLSHELRTPLTPVLLTASALVVDPALDAEVREVVSMIVEQVELEARLIDDLLDLTRIARGKFLLNLQRVDGHDLVRRAAEVCRGTLDAARVSLAVDLAAAHRDLHADPTRIQQVLCNLLNNAAKFTPAKGGVAVVTRNEGSAFVVEVTDTGVGIDAEALPRIFNAFEQGERSITRRFGGLGLGLTIGRTIADMHGGSLTAASAGKDRGATLTLRLPLVAAPVPESTDPPADAPAVRKLRVLLVDDHVPTLKMMTRLVQSLGHDVRSADSAAAALELVKTECPDMLISDIGMPGKSGWSLIADVRSACPKPPIALAISGYGTDDDLRRSRAAGFDRHLVKPIGMPDLRKAIHELTGDNAARETI